LRLGALPYDVLPRAAGAGGSSTHNLHAFVCTRPEPFRQLNGPTMDWPYILVILGIAVILYLIVSLRVLRQYERGVVFLLGKFEGVRGPGLTIIFVPIQQMVRVSLRTVTMQIPSQKIITKDNVSIDIAAVAYYHISDPEKAVIVIENVYNASRCACAISSRVKVLRSDSSVASSGDTMNRK
jgi:regulator of protease activity HflC (stomatin/prohibitin superfamily)